MELGLVQTENYSFHSSVVSLALRYPSKCEFFSQCKFFQEINLFLARENTGP